MLFTRPHSLLSLLGSLLVFVFGLCTASHESLHLQGKGHRPVKLRSSNILIRQLLTFEKDGIAILGHQFKASDGDDRTATPARDAVTERSTTSLNTPDSLANHFLPVQLDGASVPEHSTTGNQEITAGTVIPIFDPNVALSQASTNPVLVPTTPIVSGNVDNTTSNIDQQGRSVPSVDAQTQSALPSTQSSGSMLADTSGTSDFVNSVPAQSGVESGAVTSSSTIVSSTDSALKANTPTAADNAGLSSPMTGRVASTDGTGISLGSDTTTVTGAPMQQGTGEMASNPTTGSGRQINGDETSRKGEPTIDSTSQVSGQPSVAADGTQVMNNKGSQASSSDQGNPTTPSSKPTSNTSGLVGTSNASNNGTQNSSSASPPSTNNSELPNGQGRASSSHNNTSVHTVGQGGQSTAPETSKKNGASANPSTGVQIPSQGSQESSSASDQGSQTQGAGGGNTDGASGAKPTNANVIPGNSSPNTPTAGNTPGTNSPLDTLYPHGSKNGTTSNPDGGGSGSTPPTGSPGVDSKPNSPPGFPSVGANNNGTISNPDGGKVSTPPSSSSGGSTVDGSQPQDWPTTIPSTLSDDNKGLSTKSSDSAGQQGSVRLPASNVNPKQPAQQPGNQNDDVDTQQNGHVPAFGYANKQKLLMPDDSSPPAQTKQLQTASVTLPKASTSASKAANVPSTIVPQGAPSSQPAGTVLVSILFKANLSWSFLSTSPQTVAQIFLYMPSILSEACNLDPSNITTVRLQPDISSTPLSKRDTITANISDARSAYLAYIPSDIASLLVDKVKDPQSELYSMPVNSVAKALADNIDTTHNILLSPIGSTPGVAPTSTQHDSSKALRNALIGVATSLGLCIALFVVWRVWKSKREGSRREVIKSVMGRKGLGRRSTIQTFGDTAATRSPRETCALNLHEQQQVLHGYSPEMWEHGNMAPSLRGTRAPFGDATPLNHAFISSVGHAGPFMDALTNRGSQETERWSGGVPHQRDTLLSHVNPIESGSLVSVNSNTTAAQRIQQDYIDEATDRAIAFQGEYGRPQQYTSSHTYGRQQNDGRRRTNSKGSFSSRIGQPEMQRNSLLL